MPIRDPFVEGDKVWVYLPNDAFITEGTVTYDFKGSTHVHVEVIHKNGRKGELNVWSKYVYKNRECAYDHYITDLENKRAEALKQLNRLDRLIQKVTDERDHPPV